jgi:hypothetical protein
MYATEHQCQHDDQCQTRRSRASVAQFALNCSVTLSGTGSSSDLLAVDNQMVVKSLTMNGHNTLLTVIASGLPNGFREPNIALIR